MLISASRIYPSFKFSKCNKKSGDDNTARSVNSFGPDLKESGSSGFNVPEVKRVDIKYIPLEHEGKERRGTDVHKFNIPWIWGARVQLFKDGIQGRDDRVSY